MRLYLDSVPILLIRVLRYGSKNAGDWDSNGRGGCKETLSRQHLPSESCCSWDPRFPMLNACWLQNCVWTEKGEGVSLQTPSLTPSCPLYRCPLRMTSFNAQPSLFQRVSVLLLPLTFLIPPCLSLFFTFLPLSLPPFPPLECTGWQAKLFSCVIQSGSDLLEDSPISPPWTSDLIHAGKDVTTYYKGSGLFVCVCTCMWDELSKSLNLGAGLLKIVTILRQHCVCECVFTWLLEKDSVVRETEPLRGLEGGVGMIFWDCYYAVTRALWWAL